MHKYLGERHQLFNYEVAELELLDLTIRHEFEHFDSENKARYITFFLCGPKLPWLNSHVRIVSNTGSAEIRSYESELELEAALPFKIQVVPHYMYDRILEPTECELSTNVLTLVFKTELLESDLSDDEFVEQATTATEDIILLVSFLSQRRITWFRYEFTTHSIIKEFIRYIGNYSTEEPGYYDELLHRSEVRPFINKAFSKLNEYRKEGFDLKIPITLFIEGNEGRFAEDKFAISFLALEKIKDMYAKKKKMDKNIGTSAFKRLSKIIRNDVDDFLYTNKSEGAISQIKGKIPELNRPPIRFTLESLFNEYAVEWNDLYPNDGEFTVIKTRDLLFHSSVQQDAEFFVNELERLRIIVSRLLLRMLGYEKSFEPPPNQFIS
jgi:hypothetical protein